MWFGSKIRAQTRHHPCCFSTVFQWGVVRLYIMSEPLIQSLQPSWKHSCTWWCHGLTMLSTWLALCEGNPIGFPHKEPVMWSFDAYFDVSLCKLLNRQWSCQWIEMPRCSCDVTVTDQIKYHYKSMMAVKLAGHQTSYRWLVTEMTAGHHVNVSLCFF